VDSRVIIDQPGAEKLLGKGDMLFVPPDVPKPVRLQGAYIRDKEIMALVSYLKSFGIQPEYREDIYQAASTVSDRSGKSVSAGGDTVDSLYEDAKESVLSTGKASTSFLQRRLSIGYSRAAKILDELEKNGIIGPQNGSKPRDVYVTGNGPSSSPEGTLEPTGNGINATRLSTPGHSGVIEIDEYFEPPMN
jgi:S-DNA-T family DNA segregation ATPase FtsK/SpoIIIE